MRRVRGEQPLPGATEKLLQATTDTAEQQGVAEYLAVSVTTGKDGIVTVREVKLDRSSGRVLAKVLDQYDQAAAYSGLTKTEVLLYWAQEVRLRQHDSSW